MSEPAPHLVISAVSKRFGAATVLDRVDLTIRRGELVTLLGPSGCGKTTLLRAIAGLSPPDTGTIALAGRDVTHVPPHWRNVGVVFQSYALFPHLTVAGNVAFGLKVRGAPKADIDRAVQRALALVKLGHLGGRRISALSGGQQQRVALARAIAVEPDVLLFDEALSALDRKLREEMQFELRGIQQRVGTTTIMVTHDQGEALSMSDRVVVMEQGRIVQVDAPYRLYESPATSFISAFVGKMNRLSGVWRPGGVEIGGRLLPCNGAGLSEGAAAVLAIRPEKIGLKAPGAGVLDGRVKGRFFLGSAWFFTVETPAGLIGVSLPNAGEEPAREGDAVGLDWSSTSAKAAKPEGAQGA